MFQLLVASSNVIFALMCSEKRRVSSYLYFRYTSNRPTLVQHGRRANSRFSWKKGLLRCHRIKKGDHVWLYEIVSKCYFEAHIQVWILCLQDCQRYNIFFFSMTQKVHVLLNEVGPVFNAYIQLDKFYHVLYIGICFLIMVVYYW